MKSLTSAISRAAVRTCSAVLDDCAERAVDEDADRRARRDRRRRSRGDDVARRATHDASRAMARICGRKWPACGSAAVGDDEEAGDVAERVGLGDGAGGAADHDAERGADLERFGAVIERHVAARSDERLARLDGEDDAFGARLVRRRRDGIAERLERAAMVEQRRVHGAAEAKRRHLDREVRPTARTATTRRFEALCVAISRAARRR